MVNKQTSLKIEAHLLFNEPIKQGRFSMKKSNGSKPKFFFCLIVKILISKMSSTFVSMGNLPSGYL